MANTPITRKELRKLADVYVNSLTEDPNLLGNIREEDTGRGEWIYLSGFEVQETAQNNGTLRVEGQHDVVDWKTGEILAELHVTLTITRA